MSTATKITKPTATQNSGSANMGTALLAFERAVDRSRNGGRRRCGTDQPLHDRRSGVERNAAHVGHRGGLGGGDGLLGLRKLAVELALDRLAARLGFAVELVPRLIGDRLGASARVGQRLLVGRK